MASLAMYLLNQHEDLTFAPGPCEKPGVVMCACNPSAKGLGTGGSLGSMASHSSLTGDVWANERPCFRGSGQCS